MKRLSPTLSACLTLALGSAVFPTQIHADTQAPRQELPEFHVRGGLPNFFNKLEAGDDVTVAYLGGSITAQNGWRIQSLEWFQQQYPEATLKEINAALGGTGSDLGVFRLDRDVLSGHPDLLFVEFAVNDAKQQPETILRAMEGIVRKTWEQMPETDICFVYTVTHRESKQLAQGVLKPSTVVMEEVADHYDIPSVHMGYKVALLEADGKLVMKTKAPVTRVSGDELNESAAMATDASGRIIFSKEGVHPYRETGHVLYTEALARAMNAMRALPGQEVPHTLSVPMRADSYTDARLVPISAKMIQGPYAQLPDSDPLLERFGARVDTLYTLEPGATLHFKFKGTQAAIYDVLGPDGAKLAITLDGHTHKVRRMDGYCTYSRLALTKIGSNLENRIHEVTIHVLDEPLDKRSIIFEKNRGDYDANPEKYAPHVWHPAAILVVGEIVD